MKAPTRRSWASGRQPACLGGILALALALLPIPVHALTGLADLLVNGERKGSVEFEISPEGQVLLSSGTLTAMLKDVLKPSILEALKARKLSSRPVDLVPFGVRVSFDKATLELAVEVEPSSMARSRVSAARPRSEAKGQETISNAGLALTLGTALAFSPSITWDKDGQAWAYDLGLQLTPSIRALGVVAEGDMGLGWDGIAFDWTLGSAKAIVDFPRLGARLEAGTVAVSARSFQSGRQLVGLSLAREESLPGAKGRKAAMDEGFSLGRASTVTVVVNGLVSRKLRLSPGNYQLSDLALVSGINDVRIVIEEPGKDPRVIEVGVPFDESLLGSGGLDYSLALGVARDEALSEPYGAGRISLGLGPYFQAGLNLEAGYGTLLGGLTTLAATGLGNFGLEAALSLGLGDSSRNGYAARAMWRIATPARRLAPRLGLGAEYRSPGFASPSTDLPLDKAGLNLSAQLGQALPGGAGMASLYGQAWLSDSVLSSWTATLGLNGPIGHSATLSLSVGSDWAVGSGFSPRASLSLGLGRPGKGGLNYSQSYSSGTDSESLSLNLGRTGKGRVSISGQDLLTQGPTPSLELAASGRTQGASVSGFGQWSGDTNAGSYQADGNISLASTLAFAGGVLAATGDPGSAMAILVPDPSLRGQKVGLRAIRGASAESPRGRPTVLTGLVPYQSFAAGIELPESPPEAVPEPSSVQLEPAYRSIAVIRVGVAPSIAIKAILVDSRGQAVANMPGDVIAPDGKALPFAGTFTDEKGVFECFSLAPGPVSLRWADGRTSTLRVPESSGSAILSLGQILAVPALQGGKR